MVSLGYLVPGVGLDETERQRREEIANDLVPASVTVVEPDQGPVSIENTVEDHWSMRTVHRLVDRHTDRFDALVVGCFSDPGVDSARELTSTPIIGPAAATLGTAIQVADRVSLLAVNEASIPRKRRQLHELHLDERVTSVHSVDVSPSDMDHESASVAKTMTEAGRLAVEEDGAEAVVPGCMSLGFARATDRVADAIGVPCLDPVTISLETANTWARHGITHSERTYPSVPEDRRRELFRSRGEGDIGDGPEV